MESTTTMTVAPAERQGVTSTTSESPDGKKPAGASRSLPAETIPAKKPLWRLVLVTVALLTGVFLVALDVNILGSSQFRTEH